MGDDLRAPVEDEGRPLLSRWLTRSWLPTTAREEPNRASLAPERVAAEDRQHMLKPAAAGATHVSAAAASADYLADPVCPEGVVRGGRERLGLSSFGLVHPTLHTHLALSAGTCP
jgi:hypothetical protein